MRIIRLSSGVRRVRTPAGAKFFHEPIGTPITEHEYQQLLAKRREARVMHPAGHEERLRAERAVRQARKQRKSTGGEPQPEPKTVTEQAVEPKTVTEQAETKLSFTKKGTGDLEYYSANSPDGRYSYRVQKSGRQWEVRVLIPEQAILDQTMAPSAEAAFQYANTYEKTAGFFPAESGPQRVTEQPGFTPLDNGYQVIARSRAGTPLSLHPTGEGDFARWFNTEREAHEFINTAPQAYRYSPNWSVDNKAGPTEKATVGHFFIRKYVNGEVDPEAFTERGAGSYYYADPESGDDVAALPVEFGRDLPLTGSSTQQKADAINAHIRDAYRKQYALVPGVIKNIRTLVTQKVSELNPGALGSHLAASTGEGGTIRVRPNVFREANEDPENPPQVLARTLERKWWVPTDPHLSLSQTVLGHEVGHGVAYRAFGYAASGLPLDFEFWRQLLTEMRDAATTTHYLRDARLQLGVSNLPADPQFIREGKLPNAYALDAEIARWLQQEQMSMLVKYTVSQYAATNGRELLAELWNEYSQGLSPRGPAKYYGKYVLNALRAEGLAP